MRDSYDEMLGGTVATVACTVRYGMARYSTSTSAYFVEASITYATFTDLAGEFYI